MSNMEAQERLLHLYYGPRKRKTSAAMGLAVRALGHGQTITVFQFMKGAEEMREQYEEVQLFEELDGIEAQQFPAGHAPTPDDLTQSERETLNEGLLRP